MSKAEALQKAQIELMGLTARDIIAYSEEAKSGLTGPEAPAAQRLLDWDIAKARFEARDFEAALTGYSQLRQGLNPDSEEYYLLAVAMSQCRSALRNPKPMDYEMHIYAHPYYWAPFVLEGDWK